MVDKLYVDIVTNVNAVDLNDFNTSTYYGPQTIQGSGTATAYTGKLQAIPNASLIGFSIIFIPSVVNGANVSLTIPSSPYNGVLPLYLEGLPIAAGALQAGSPYILTYEGAFWALSPSAFSAVSTLVLGSVAALRLPKLKCAQVNTTGYYTPADGGGGSYVPVPSDTTSGAFYTGSISGTVLTVTAVTNGTLAIGQAVSLSSTGGTVGYISSLGTGAGGVGTYNLTTGGTFTSQVMMADNGGSIIVDTQGLRWYLERTEYVNVRLFGAVGNGIADDTGAISSAALYASLVQPATILFPKGTYSYTAFLIAVSNVSVCGEGQGVTILRPNGYVDGVLFADGYPTPTAMLSNNSIHDLTIDGVNQSAGTSDTHGNGVNFNSCDKFSCHRVTLINVKQQQIVSTFAQVLGVAQTAGSITDNFVDAYYTNDICIGAEGLSSNVIIARNVVINCINTSAAGVYVGNVAGGSAAGNIIIDANILSGTNGVGIVVQDAYTNVTISNNHINGFPIGIRTSWLGVTATYDYLINNNKIEEWTEYGIITYPVAAGVNSDCLITGNNIKSSVAVAAGNNSGIYGANNVAIMGNRIRITNAAVIYGISLAGVGCFVSGNYIAGFGGSVNCAGTTAAVVLGNYTDSNMAPLADTFASANGGPVSSQQWTANYFENQQNVVVGAAPTTGTWNQGDRAWLNLPTHLGSMGWVCTASGTPGTWYPFGPIS